MIRKKDYFNIFISCSYLNDDILFLPNFLYAYFHIFRCFCDYFKFSISFEGCYLNEQFLAQMHTGGAPHVPPQKTLKNCNIKMQTRKQRTPSQVFSQPTCTPSKEFENDCLSMVPCFEYLFLVGAFYFCGGCRNVAPDCFCDLSCSCKVDRCGFRHSVLKCRVDLQLGETRSSLPRDLKFYIANHFKSELLVKLNLLK